MEIIFVFIFLFLSIGFFAYQFFTKRMIEDVHLPVDIRGNINTRRNNLKELLNRLARFTDRLIGKDNVLIENLKRKLTSAGRPIGPSQFITLQWLLMVGLPVGAFILFPSQPLFMLLAFVVGFFLPEYWLKGQVAKRQLNILRALPHIIDLLNICVGAGLDFMMAVKRVSREFRPCALVEELKITIHEIEMGNSRREAMKNMSLRVASPEMASFVRTLLQADRMGTPIAEALKIQAEELRIRRFQKGEEAGLKAPIKLLIPLLFFILPVVLIIVAGPILIQFTRGGLMKM